MPLGVYLQESYVQAAGLVACVGVISECSASLLGQLLISQGVPLRVLFDLSGIFTALAVCVVCLLPTQTSRSWKAPLLSQSNVNRVDIDSVPSVPMDGSNHPSAKLGRSHQRQHQEGQEQLEEHNH